MKFKFLSLILILSLIGSVFAFNYSNQSNSTEVFQIEKKSLPEKQTNLSLDSKKVKKTLIKKSKENYEIKLNGQKKTYDELSSKKFNLFSKKSNSKNYYLVQFYNKLSKQEINSLKKEGITVLENLGYNAYYISFKDCNLLEQSKDKKFANVDYSLELDNYLSSNNAVRSIEEIDSDFKLSKNLKNKKIETWNLDSEGNLYLNVQFHRDVTLDRAETLMKSKGFEVISRLESINALTIKIKGGEKSE